MRKRKPDSRRSLRDRSARRASPAWVVDAATGSARLDLPADREGARRCDRGAIGDFLRTLSLWILISTTAMACPNCKEGLADSAGGENLARGFELSIYLMLAMPPLILGTLGSLFYLQIRRARKNPELWLDAVHGHVSTSE